MDKSAALELRMRSLLLRGSPGRVAAIVEWFGAMQAQDVNSGLWSLGARLPGAKIDDINAALERREAIRTWPMRGTVHWVPPADARWMLELMGVRSLVGSERRRQQIGLSAADADRAVELLGSALAGGKRLTRAECLRTLTEGGIAVGGQIGYHLLWYACQQGVAAIAPHVGKEQTFVLLDEWAPEPRRPDRDEALGIIALRYFRSHGPTTLKDFAGWTGLTMTDCRTGIAVAGKALAPVDVDGVEMLMAAEPPAVGGAAADSVAVGGVASAAAGSDGGGWLALPGFDEYLLGYKDRSMMGTPEQLAAVIPGGNGVFQSTLVRGGRVMATWKRTIRRNGVTVTVQPLAKFTSRDRHNAEAALQPFADYLGLPLTVKNP
ncbi:winged helix DNA-binding domain-containing protein [Actinoplanes sp. NPDC051343]|uniref:winged helix DNA-binding domain-containing protein n=1 Tax=Actinoplanes sp. NPDC051343 TaxID=3363906 RepID=UPI0037A8C693